MAGLKKNKRDIRNIEVHQYDALLKRWAEARRFVGSARVFLGIPPT